MAGSDRLIQEAIHRGTKTLRGWELCFDKKKAGPPAFGTVSPPSATVAVLTYKLCS